MIPHSFSYHIWVMLMLYELTKVKTRRVLLACFIVFLLIILKLGYTQLVSYSYLKNRADDLWQRSFPVEGDRGEILDQDGEVLATNLTTSSLVVIPSQINDPALASQKLAEILDCDAALLFEKLSKRASIVRIAPEGRQLDDKKSADIAALHMNGLYLIKDSKRYYPNGAYLSHVLGFVGIDNQGLVGLELKYDEFLVAKKGSINYYMDAKGYSLPLYPTEYVAPSSGMDLVLSVDADIQSVVERELNNAYETYDPDGIWALAMDPDSGAILAMASKPDFDPNHYSDYSSEIYNQNIPIWKTYEPGSTFKIITFASALNENLFDMDKDTYYDIGYEYVGGARIKSWKAGGHGLQTFREVLQNSSNPGFVEIGRRLGKEKMLSYIENFGLTEATGIDLVGESSGIMFSEENFGPLEQATVAFGQGISITPIQLVRAVSACVNGGYLYEPYIVDKVLDPLTGDVISEHEPVCVRQVISEETSAKMRDALETVVSDGGGRNAYIEGYRIGGKTGTAQKAVNGSYVGGGYILSFIGIAPIDDPEIVLYVAMDNPKNCVQYGGTTVAPIARSMLVDILPIMGVEKVSSQRPKVKSWNDVETYEIENYIGKKKSEVHSDVFSFQFVGEGDVVIDQLPRSQEKLPQGSTIMIMLGES